MEMQSILKGLVKGLVEAGEIKIPEKIVLNAYMTEIERDAEELKECE